MLPPKIPTNMCFLLFIVYILTISKINVIFSTKHDFNWWNIVTWGLESSFKIVNYHKRLKIYRLVQVISAIKAVPYYPSKIRIIKSKANFYVDTSHPFLMQVTPCYGRYWDLSEGISRILCSSNMEYLWWYRHFFTIVGTINGYTPLNKTIHWDWFVIRMLKRAR